MPKVEIKEESWELEKVFVLQTPELYLSMAGLSASMPGTAQETRGSTQARWSWPAEGGQNYQGR